jgi:hypothetical protein
VNETYVFKYNFKFVGGVEDETQQQSSLIAFFVGFRRAEPPNLRTGFFSPARDSVLSDFSLENSRRMLRLSR